VQKVCAAFQLMAGIKGRFSLSSLAAEEAEREPNSACLLSPGLVAQG
jgi:hypothetical protein